MADPRGSADPPGGADQHRWDGVKTERERVSLPRRRSSSRHVVGASPQARRSDYDFLVLYETFAHRWNAIQSCVSLINKDGQAISCSISGSLDETSQALRRDARECQLAISRHHSSGRDTLRQCALFPEPGSAIVQLADRTQSGERQGHTPYCRGSRLGICRPLAGQPRKSCTGKVTSLTHHMPHAAAT